MDTLARPRHVLLIVLGLALASCGGSGSSDQSAGSQPIELVAQHELGLAYADSSVNVSVFREKSILSLPHGEHAVAYYDQYGDVRIDVLSVAGTTRRAARVTPRISDHLLADGHSGISLGRSVDGMIHVLYGAHATPPYYAAFDEDLLRDMPATVEITATLWPMDLTYPQFYNVGSELQLWHRVDPENSVGRMIYDPAGGGFFFDSQVLLTPGDADRVYMNNLAVQGTNLGLAWVYRLFSTDDMVRNEGLYIARSSDSGASWSELDGTPMVLPSIRGTVPAVVDVPDSLQPLNQVASAYGPDGWLYVTYYAKNSDGIHQIFLVTVRPDGSTEAPSKVSDNTQAFDLLGRGTLVLPLSRPQIAVSEKYVHVFYRQQDEIVFASRPTANSSAAWIHTRFDAGPLGAWEPTFDRESWRENHQLYLYVQEARQGPLDTGAQGEPTPARVVVFAEPPNAP